MAFVRYPSSACGSYMNYDTNSFDSSSQARANILTHSKGMKIEVELPGFSRSDISVEAKGSTLSIRAKRDTASPSNDAKYHSTEFNSTSLSRSWTLPKYINVERIEAEYEAGILTLNMPYRDEAVQEARRIEIR